MACIRSQFDVNVGPLIKIGISSPGTSLSASPHKVATAWALIDTGAEISSIFASVAGRAGALSLEKRRMVSANHTKLVSIYLVDLQVHLDEIVQFPALEVAEFEASGRSRFQALLGRDVLCKGSLFMAGGAYEFCL